MKKFAAFSVIVFLLILLGGISILSKKEGSPTSSGQESLPNSYEYFWSRTCPHCTKVQQFFDGWEKGEEVEVDKKEVSNPQNTNLLRRRGTYCNLPQTEIGVPFLFTPEGECIVGDEPIISFFKEL